MINEKELGYKISNTYNYKSIPIYAEKWVHEWVFEKFIEFNFDKNLNILILWCWAGAFDQRLIDYWYKNLLSIDIEIEFYKAENKNLIKKDLNTDFSDLWNFDIIFSIEIIEHIENSFHFIKNISMLLKKWWYLFLTTPNIEAPFSRFSFLITWYLNSFSQLSLKWLGHINPILKHIFYYNINLNWLTCKEKLELCYLKINVKSIRAIIWSLIYKLFTIFIIWKNNIIDFYIIKK